MNSDITWNSWVGYIMHLLWKLKMNEKSKLIFRDTMTRNPEAKTNAD